MQTATYCDISASIEQARRGDAAAFAGIVRRYQSLVSGVLFSATGDFHKSEDLAQETFLIAWNKLGELKNSADIAPWLCTIARNLAHRSFRKKQVSADSLPDAQVSPEPGPVNEALRREQSELVWSAIAEIPEPYRETLVLYYRNGQSIAEIAAATASSEEAIRQRLVRARKSLKVKLETLIGDILTDSAPGEFFTRSVMAAVTSGVVLASGETLLAASTATTVTGAGTTTGKVTGVSLFWAILGPLAYFFATFTFIWVGIWTSVRNVPTLQARRLKLYNVFWGCQFTIISHCLVAIPFTYAVLFVFPYFSSGTELFYGAGFYFCLLYFAIVSWGVIRPVHKRNARLLKTKLEYELGLADKDTFPCDFNKVVRRFHLALLTNLLLAETLILAFAVLAVTVLHLHPINTLIVVGVSGMVLGLSFSVCSRLGQHLLEMCRTRESLQTMPPLIGDAYGAALGKPQKSQMGTDHPKRAKKTHWLFICACLICAVFTVWFYAQEVFLVQDIDWMGVLFVVSLLAAYLF